MTREWQAELSATLRASRVTVQAPLRGLTTLRIGGPAECLVEVGSEEDLVALFAAIRARALPYFVLGKGSNLVNPAGGLRGVVIRLGRFFREVSRCEATVRAGAGCANPAFLGQCRRWGLGGMEFLIAVPGTIGGAIAMNAGAHEGETAAFLRSVRYLDVERGMVEAPAAGMVFAYRTSPLRGQQGRVVVAGEFLLEPMADEAIRERMDTFQAYRRDTQPRDFPNCCSVFKNPPGDYAARLIEEAGLKGKAVGGAQVSEKHANFIVNRGGATAHDVLALIDIIRDSVYHRSGIELHMELQVL